MRLLKALYEHSKATSDPAFVEHLASGTGLTELEAHHAWSYLKDKRLIQTFSIPHTARINAHGIDAIEEAEQHPDQPARSFPAVTYNIVNNTTNIGTAVNSPVQQTAGSSQPDQSKSASTKKTFIERLTSRTTTLTALLVTVTALLAAVPPIRKAANDAYCSVISCPTASPKPSIPSPSASAAPPVSDAPAARRFTFDSFDTLDGSRAKSGTISQISVSIVDNRGRKPDTYVAEWTWSGSGGTQNGSQTVVVDLKSASGATLESLTFPLDRSHCYYPGNPQRFAGDLKNAASLVASIQVSVTAVEGRQGRC
ncbi:hypothetical protein [Bradyrhizobium archetypum]|uniref:Uncharacterized protein n=1 Tax=Bradyrhizobium archetypum TaxID=2721160 RepID=A0A7Y4GZ78_9BRAD|nr:hypothetical protein [Bradyrhizobium archetypum]NOJ44720.1 hypothetical protein [Bradyrhizobium archetypum]